LKRIKVQINLEILEIAMLCLHSLYTVHNFFGPNFLIFSTLYTCLRLEFYSIMLLRYTVLLELSKHFRSAVVSIREYFVSKPMEQL